jgi:hypothetical protein
MFEAYRIRPVVEWEGSDESREVEAFDALGEASAKQAQLMRDDPHADVEPRIFWTLYGINPETDGVRTEDAIADRITEADALELLGRLSDGLPPIPVPAATGTTSPTDPRPNLNLKMRMTVHRSKFLSPYRSTWPCCDGRRDPSSSLYQAPSLRLNRTRS